MTSFLFLLLLNYFFFLHSQLFEILCDGLFVSVVEVDQKRDEESGQGVSGVLANVYAVLLPDLKAVVVHDQDETLGGFGRGQ